MSQFTRQIHWQHGFVKGRSTATQLILTQHQWAKALDEGHQVHVVFLDFLKAFDRVPHQALLEGFNGVNRQMAKKSTVNSQISFLNFF